MFVNNLWIDFYIFWQYNLSYGLCRDAKGLSGFFIHTRKLKNGET